MAGTALANPVPRAEAALDNYVIARTAVSIGRTGEALDGYRRALASAPDDPVIAQSAFDQALAAGDQELAFSAAQAVERAGAANSEVRLTLIAAAILAKDWVAAERHIAAVSRDEALGFVAPILGAWTAIGSHNAEPVELLEKTPTNPVGASYAQQHRPLLLLATGRTKEGLAALRERVAQRDFRADRLKLAGAARLSRKGKRKEALALLEGRSSLLAIARERVAARQRLQGEIVTPAHGAAELFVRLAIDLSRQNQDDLALSFARLATFLAPEDSEPWIVTSALLTEQDRSDDALVTLRQIASDDLAAGVVSDMRVQLLANSGSGPAALQQAHDAVQLSSANSRDWERLGDVFTQLDRHKEAAEAFAKAIDVKQAEGSAPDWSLWFSKGAALDLAGQWTEAKAALETARKIAPAEPLVLNYLGYAQLVRRENLEQAEDMIRQARRLDPESGQIIDSHGWARYLRGDPAEAIRLLERALVVEPSDPTINEHLGDAYHSVGRRFEARYAWQAALVTAKDKDADRLRAKIKDGYSPELASP